LGRLLALLAWVAWVARLRLHFVVLLVVAQMRWRVNNTVVDRLARLLVRRANLVGSRVWKVKVIHLLRRVVHVLQIALRVIWMKNGWRAKAVGTSSAVVL
jgi:hypothetical protein